MTRHEQTWQPEKINKEEELHSIKYSIQHLSTKENQPLITKNKRNV
jgi:hypothetical protein